MQKMGEINTEMQQALAEWTKVFPLQVTDNYTSSVTFMKQLTVVAVSAITDAKNLFSAENYSVQPFVGLQLRILDSECKDVMAQFISMGLLQAFDAFDKKYLHQLVLCFYESECRIDSLLEYHVFEYVYKDDGVTMIMNSKNRDRSATSIDCDFKDVMEMTQRLIRACVVVMSSSQRLPDNYDVSIRLYYNENAPEGYQAPGYLHSLDHEDPMNKSFSWDATGIKSGSVETPFHKLVLRTYFKDDFGTSCEVNTSQKVPYEMTGSQSEMQTTGGDRSGSAETDVGSQVPLRCVCEMDTYDPLDALDTLLTCQYCRSQQHAACYGLTPRQAALMTSHCCVTCFDRQPARTPTDPMFSAMDLKKRTSVAIFRRALALCAQSVSVATRDICTRFRLSTVNASKVMKVLHTNGIIRQGRNSDITTPLTVIHDQLNAVMAEYFKTFDENNIVNRLMDETLASQETIDPLGKVLSPLEKETLQDASNIGRVIGNTPKGNIADSTLKQYREAFTLVEKVDVDPLKWTYSAEKLGKKRKAVDVEKNKRGKGGVRSKKEMRKA